MIRMDFPGGSVVKNQPANAGDVGSIPGSGRSPGEGNGNPLQYSCWEILWTEEPGGLQSMGSQESDITERLNNNNKKMIRIITGADTHKLLLMPSLYR